MSNTLRHLEVAVVADSSAKPWSVTILDGYSYSRVMKYKGDICTPHTLSFIGDDYLISAVLEKSILQVWALHGSDQIHLKMTSPGKVSALAVSTDGLYCVAGVNEKLHIWKVATGDLLAVVSQHYQNISCIKFTSEDYFLTGSEDTQVLVWSLSKLLSKNWRTTGDRPSNAEPIFLWNQHSLPVKDIFVSKGGPSSRVATCSLDRTCRIYELSSGQQLLVIVMQVPLVSVCMDPAELCVFMGSANGNIYVFKLTNAPRTLEYHPDFATEVNNIFAGHEKKVNCLTVSMDGNTLLSGSDDMTCRFWHIPSRQCMRVLTQNGSVTSVHFTIAFNNLFAQEKSKPSLEIRAFQRYIKDADEDETASTSSSVSSIPPNTIPLHRSGVETAQEQLQKLMEGDDEEISKKTEEKLKSINKKLFLYKLESSLSKIKTSKKKKLY